MARKSFAGGGQGGFTVVELAVSLLVTVEVLVAVLLLFDFSNRVSRVQTNLADLQGSMRAAEDEMERYVRMSGRGSLPVIAATANPGGAVRVRDNVGDPNDPGSTVTIGGAGTPTVMWGSDVLIVRGVFNTPLYQINTLNAAAYVLRTAGGVVTTNPALAASGVLQIAALSPGGVTQDRQPLIDAVTAGIPEALVLVNGRTAGAYAVVQLNPAASNPAAGTVAFTIQGGGAPDYTAAYRALSPGGVFPANMTTVSYVGLLEEYRYYVRRGVPAELPPHLSRARVLPGTEVPWGPGAAGDATNWAQDVADNVLDLQLALGFDSPVHVPRVPAVPGEPGGLTTVAANPDAGYISESTNGNGDDWLFNGPTDNPNAAQWANAQLYYVRWNLLARTARRDPGYEAPVLGRIEDRTYAAVDPLNLENKANGTERMYRRRILQTVVNLRNL